MKTLADRFRQWQDYTAKTLEMLESVPTDQAVTLVNMTTTPKRASSARP